MEGYTQTVETSSRVKYQAWIDANYPTMESALGKCGEAVQAMKQVFPELIVTNGIVHLSYNSVEQLHWWLKDEQGLIVDPTKRQFEGHIILRYEEIDDSHPARNYHRRKCPNCGQYFYESPEALRSSPCCTPLCYQDFANYLNGNEED